MSAAANPHSRTSHRVLVLSADMGGGHNATAAALEQAVDRVWPGSEIRRLDALDVMGPGVGRLFRGIYVSNVERTPWLYEFFYATLWRQRWFSNASKRFTGSWCGRRLVPRIDEFDPDVVLSTYPLASSGLAWLRDHRGLTLPAAGWVSDFAPHPFWVYRQLDANFVMHRDAVPVALAAEPSARVEVSGAPVVTDFHPGDRAEARELADLRPEALVVLLSCGAYAFGDTLALVRTLVDVSDEVQVVAVCGHNEATRKQLDYLGLDRRSLLPLGWTDDMPMLVRAADLVLTNAGGATALEALAVGTPVVTACPIAAHGDANADLMAVAGLTELCSDQERLADLVRTAVVDRGSLEPLRRRTIRHGQEHDLDSGLRQLGLLGYRRNPDDGPASGTGRRWPMRAGDAFFSHVESDTRRQELGAVVELEPSAEGPPLTAAAVREQMRSRESLPPVRRTRAVDPPGWLLQDTVDVDQHVSDVELGKDPTDERAWRAASDLWERPLPDDRPSWVMRLVRGRPDGSALLAVKMHHSQGDGVSEVGLLDRLLDTDEDDPLSERRSAPGRPRRRHDLALVGRGLVSLAVRGTAPAHPVNAVASSSGRELVGVPLPWAELRDLARSQGVRPHELVLGLVADALDRLLRPAGLISAGLPLRAMVPIAMRPPKLDRIFGNWTGSVAVDLPTGPMPVADRVAQVADELHSRLRRGDAHAAAVVMRLAGRLPHRAHRWFARSVYNQKFFDTIVSFMPGPRGARWMAGAKVRAIYPVLPLTEGVPLTVGVVVADGTAGVGVTLDARLGLDREKVEAALRDAFDEARRHPE